jgi:hypothetical protein
LFCVVKGDYVCTTTRGFKSVSPETGAGVKKEITRL